MFHRICLILVACIALSNQSSGKDVRIVTNVSPKLRQFLVDHPAALRTLTNVFSEAFAQRTPWIYYFYSDDESLARASHDYPSDSDVAIYLRENQEPLDEFICLVFEARNSTSEKQFLALFDKARTGVISRHDFALAFARLEFNAAKQTRDLLKNLKLAERDRKRSHDYQRFAALPDDFDQFLDYTKKLSPSKDLLRESEAKYDLLQSERESPNKNAVHEGTGQ